MTIARALALALLLSTAASAQTVEGVVDVVREEGPDGSARVIHLQTESGVERITDPEVVRVLAWLDGERVVLEGAAEAQPGEQAERPAFAVEQIVEPRLLPNVTGVLWSNKRGLSGRRRVLLPDGTEARISGPNFLALFSLTKDLKKREITFSAFPLRGDDGAIEELVIMEVEARARRDLILRDATAGILAKLILLPLLFVDPPEIHGEVRADEVVWVQRRSLMGGSLLVRRGEQVGFTSRDAVEIGRVIDDTADDAPVAGASTPSDQGDGALTPARRGGAVGQLQD
jgi:hypothetical protein